MTTYLPWSSIGRKSYKPKAIGSFIKLSIFANRNIIVYKTQLDAYTIFNGLIFTL